MPTALQLPFRETPAESLGSKLFRKQVLPLGTLDYEGRTLRFDKPYLQRLVENFKAKAFDQVAFVLADKDNSHSDDPERFRGEVMGFEMTDDGLDAIVELTDEGAKIVHDNPRLGVSPRIVEEQVPGMNGARAPAIHHVCGTLTGRLNALRDWEPVSDLTKTYSADQVIDLTAATYNEMPGTDADTKLTEEQRTKLLELIGDDAELKGGVEKLLEESDGGESKEAAAAAAKKPDEKKEPGKLKQFITKIKGDEIDDTQVEAELQAMIDAEKDEEKEPVALSKEATKAIELAASDSRKARDDAAAAQAELRQERFERRKAELIADGVPPADIDLAKPILMASETAVIELSGGEKTSAHEIVTKLLNERKNTIDLSTGYGSEVGEDDSQASEAKEAAKKWGESVDGEKAEAK